MKAIPVTLHYKCRQAFLNCVPRPKGKNFPSKRAAIEFAKKYVRGAYKITPQMEEYAWRCPYSGIWDENNQLIDTD